MPAVRGANPQVPGRSGSLRVDNKVFDDGSLILKMWVIGADADGLISSTAMTHFRANVDALQQLFGKRVGTLDVQQTWPQGVRQANCEVLQAFDMSSRAIQPRGIFSVALNIPGVFWQDLSTSDYTSSTGLTPASVLTMAVYNGASAPMEDMVFVVRGPATNPRLTDVLSGSWVQYNGTIAAGTDWQVDSSLWTSKTGASLAFGAGGTNVIAATTTGGPGPRFLPLTARTGGPQVRLDGSSFGSQTQLLARGRRKYFT